MGHTLLCELGLFLLYTLLYKGHAQVPNKVTVTLQPNSPQIYSGEEITLRCEIHGGDTEWEYEWTSTSSYKPPNLKEFRIKSASSLHTGDYKCKGRMKSGEQSSTEWSDSFRLTVFIKRPRVTLTAEPTTIPVGGRVTLTCSVETSAGWKYEWFRRTTDTSEVQVRTNDGENRVISVSQGGIYRCIGGRGAPVYYTDPSYPVTIEITFSNKAVVTRQPNWPQIFRGEKITLTCEVQGGKDTEWKYEWRTPRSFIDWTYNKYWTFTASESSSGDYKCKSRHRDDSYSSTEWSKAITLSVAVTPQPVLSVSPSWLSPGASVTLSCELEHPSAGWRFYWYKAVPDLSHNHPFYNYELLPGSISGTEQDSYIIDGQTHTAGYVCGAGRGDPVFYTDYSRRHFVWSGDFHSAASLSVNPDRVQHFTSDSVSLSCEGNSTEWRVRRFTDNGFLSHCSTWGTMTGSTCNVNRLGYSNAVYWCESGSAFSNTVNISGQTGDIILVSPVHPVTEGDSVTLGCKLKTQNVLSNVFFYQNDKLIQSDTREELIISAVSKTHEGFYKCQSSGKQSAQSWMAVTLSRSESSSFLLPLIVGLVCGVSLILLLLLLCLYKQSKDSCFIRSQSTNQSSATDHMINQDEGQQSEYASPLHGDACLYESIKVPEDTENDESRDATYSLIELKNITKKEKKQKPEESCVYSAVKIGSSADDGLMYEQVPRETKPAPVAADETFYSEINPGTSHGQ